MNMEKNRAVVIGGGAAGMMAAAAAAENGRPVILLEKNEKLGKKLYIRRRHSNHSCGRDKFFENIVSNPKFLYSAFHTFDNKRLEMFLENNGCHLKEERGERVFPVSDHASDVTAAFERFLKKNGVQVRLHSEVRSIETDGGKITGVTFWVAGFRGKCDRGDGRSVLSGHRFYRGRSSYGAVFGAYGDGLRAGAGLSGDGGGLV